MRVYKIYVPVYLPPSHPGATPTPYQSGTVDKFKLALFNLVGDICDYHENGHSKQISAGQTPNGLTERWLVSFSIAILPGRQALLGKAIALALKSFNLSKVAVEHGADAEIFDAEAAQELLDGVHPWNEEV